LMDWKDGSGLSIRYRIRNISKYGINFLLQKINTIPISKVRK
jgi:hypothetical protein